MKYKLYGSLLLSSLLYADNSVYELGRIEVVDENSISQNKTKVTIDKQMIEDTQSNNVVEALQVIPGANVQKIGKKNLTEIRLRGFDNRRIPIYVDGIPVYVPYNRETDLGRYTTYDISEINVSKGYVSPMYGPNTLGGAINLVTRKPQKEIEGEMGIGVFSGNGREEFLTIGTNQGKYYGLLSVSNYQRDYYNLSDDFVPAGKEDGGRRENSDSKDFKVNVKLGYTPNDTDEYSFNYIMQRAEKGNPYYASDYEGGDEGSRRGYRTREWRWPDWDKTSYYFVSQTALGEHTLKTRLFYDKFYNKLVDQKWGWSSEYDDYSIGLSSELDLKLSDSRLLKLSLMQKNDYHKDISSDYPGLDIEVEGQTQSLGIEHSWKLTDKLKWVVGLSYDKNKVNKAQYRDSGTIGEWDTYDTDFLSPQTALYYKFNEDTTFFTAFGIRSNMPTLSNRYSSGFGEDLPNPNLKAEQASSYEIGLEHRLEDHLIKSSIFFIQTDDYIASVSVTPDGTFCTGSSCSQYQNVGKEEHLGFELSLDSYWTDTLSTNLAYTYIDFELKESEDPAIKYITGLPEHSLNFFLKYEPMAKLAIMPKLRYESERYVDNTVSTPTTKSFIVMDLKTTYDINNKIEVSAGINNIFDKFYYYTEGHPTEGRNYYATLKYKF